MPGILERYIALENFFVHAERERETGKQRDATGFRQDSYWRILFLSMKVSTTLEAESFLSAYNTEELRYTRAGGFIRIYGTRIASASLRYPCNRLSNISFLLFFLPEILFVEDARDATTARRR